ncbi:Oligopeptide transporter [Theobroma cacao]|nr:Oligopeptide transporter [Theobroma cacao]
MEVEGKTPQSQFPDKVQPAKNVEEEEVDDNPIEEVRLTVPITDDPTESALTFRTWVLGLISCCILAFVNQFFAYRQNQLSISSISAQIVVLPIGKLMAATLPKKEIRVPFTKWSFSLNPGPFTLKEHALITIFANCGAGGVYAVNIITIVKAFYHRSLHPVAAMLLAQTTQQPGLNVITELVIGYMYPGKPLANVAFKTYGYISMVQALNLVGDFKLGHYMKIPPKSMFIVQLVGTVVASSCYFGTAWWLLSSIQHICDPALLPEGSPWTCPGDDVFYNASIIWGVVGPLRMFSKYGNYPQMNWFFLIGLLAPVPVWWLSRKFPEKKWIRLIHMPMILGATQGMPPAKAVHYICWGTVGIFFNWYVYNRYKRWWGKHTYILSAALDAGVAFMGVLLYFTLQSHDIVGPEWWGLDATDHCPLARCPTAKGIMSKGCPVL